MRSTLLWASQNQRLREALPKYRFVRKAVSRFMPGEDLSDALKAAEDMRQKGLSAVLTHLGENVTQPAEASQVTEDYLQVLNSVPPGNSDCHISLKLTHLGLDLDAALCRSNLEKIVTKALERKNFVWIDMEDSKYTDRTIDLYSQVRSRFPNVGLCVQAYMFRTKEDLQKLISISSAIRLVKGCYAEPANLVYQKKSDVDENYFQLCMELLQAAQRNGARVGIATHDQVLIERILKEMAARGIPKETGEIQMLYGIRSADQFRLRKEGVPVRCLISYGSYWFPWYMRRLAERPANVLFVLRNMFEP